MKPAPHVIVTDGLTADDFIRERCDLAEFEEWSRFIADPCHAPEATEPYTGVPAAEVRAAARLFATGGNGAIYYGLGVTEHSRGSTTVMAIANLAMATGNIGRPGVGVNPLRGQNNVQGSCDMGSFPHEFSGYRHVGDDATRHVFEMIWGVALDHEPGLRIPNMLMARCMVISRGLCARRRYRPFRSQHPVRHRRFGRDGMCCRPGFVLERETAKYAHVFLPAPFRKRMVPSPMPNGASIACGK